LHVGVEIVVLDIERRHRHARRAGEAAPDETFQHRPIARREFLQDDKLRPARPCEIDNLAAKNLRHLAGRHRV
jgi:hypothetical protein